MTIETGSAAAGGLRRSLKWGLGATSVATLATLLWPAPAIVSVSAGHEVAARSGARVASDATVGRPLATEEGSRPLAEAAAASIAGAFDPFAGAPVTPPVPPPAAAPSAPVIAPPPPPPPPPPAQDYRFFGRMTGPDGAEQVLLGRGEVSVSIAKGTVLDNGYVVESISKDAVVLVFPSLGLRTSIPMPPE